MAAFMRRVVAISVDSFWAADSTGIFLSNLIVLRVFLASAPYDFLNFRKSLDLAEMLQIISRMPASVWAWPLLATNKTDRWGGCALRNRASSKRVAMPTASSAPGESPATVGVLS